MQSQSLRPSSQSLCLLLVFMAIPVCATPQEGAILQKWASNITDLSNNMPARSGALGSWFANSIDPCGIDVIWTYVSCNQSSNVWTIDFRTANFSGQLIPELGQLSRLSSLILSENDFTGSIPAELGNLPALTSLFLAGNRLSGPIPASLGNLTTLERLYLGTNAFTGSIPAELGNLSALTVLGLNGNQITGSIPAELGNLTALTRLDLSGNRITGPIPDFGRSKLEALILNNNMLNGPYPESLATIPTLIYINLAGNSISGDLNATQILESLNTTAVKYNLSYKIQAMGLANTKILKILPMSNDSLRNCSVVAFELQGNPYCTDLGPDLTELKNYSCQASVCFLTDYYSTRPPGTKPNHRLAIIIGTTCGAVALVAICVAVIVKRFAKPKLSKLEIEYQQNELYYGNAGL